MDNINKRFVGKKYEEIAEKYLTDNGYIIKEKNFFTDFGEIDIIGYNEGYLCFIEVKARFKNPVALGLCSVNYEKQGTISYVAKYYLYKNHIKEDKTPCRFDVVSIDKGKITLIKNAFSFVKKRKRRKRL